MTPEELAQNFVRQFDKLCNDDKSVCLNKIASIFSVKYDLNLGFCLESKTNTVDEYFVVPLYTTTVTFTWDEDTSNLEWSVFGVNDK